MSRTHFRKIKGVSDFNREEDLRRLLCNIQHKAGIDTYKHSINVARILMIASRDLGMDQNQIRTYGLMGLFHDTGKLFLPDGLLNYSGIYSDLQKRTIASHTALGAHYLKEIHAPAQIIRSASEHHEFYTKNALSWDIGLLEAIDIYEACRSFRVYHPERTHEKTVEIMQQDIEIGKLDERICKMVWDALESHLYDNEIPDDLLFQRILDPKGWEQFTKPLPLIYAFDDMCASPVRTDIQQEIIYA